jgi:hypothetical protein
MVHFRCFHVLFYELFAGLLCSVDRVRELFENVSGFGKRMLSCGLAHHALAADCVSVVLEWRFNRRHLSFSSECERYRWFILWLCAQCRSNCAMQPVCAVVAAGIACLEYRGRANASANVDDDATKMTKLTSARFESARDIPVGSTESDYSLVPAPNNLDHSGVIDVESSLARNDSYSLAPAPATVAD